MALSESVRILDTSLYTFSSALQHFLKELMLCWHCTHLMLEERNNQIFFIIYCESVTIGVTRSNPFHIANSSILEQNNNNLMMISVAVVAMVSIRIAVVSTVSIAVGSVAVVMSVVGISLGLSISRPLAVVVTISIRVGITIVSMVSQAISVSVVSQSVSVVSVEGISLGLSISRPEIKDSLK